MLILASGADKVRKLERALGGTPPKSDTAIRELTRMMRQRWEKRRAFRREMNKMLDRAQAPVREQFKKDPRIASSFKEMRRFVERRSKGPAPKLKRIKVEPQMAAGSGFSLHAPPYDAAFSSADATQISAFADQNSGDLGYEGSGRGNPLLPASAWAGFASNFFALSDDPQQRAAALIRWIDRWVDLAAPGYWSENAGDTFLYVWDSTEGTWVMGRDYYWPTWEAGGSFASGLYIKGSSGNTGDWEGGTESIEISFPARANSWYTVYVGFNLTLWDDSGGSYAQACLNATVPFMVFGSL